MVKLLSWKGTGDASPKVSQSCCPGLSSGLFPTYLAGPPPTSQRNHVAPGLTFVF